MPSSLRDMRSSKSPCVSYASASRWLPQNSWMRPASTVACQRSSRLASLMTRLPRPVLPSAFCTEGILCQCVDKPESWKIRSAPAHTRSSRGRPSCCQCASCRCTPDTHGDHIHTDVDDVTTARADERRWLTVDLLAGPASILISCELLQLRNWHSEVLKEQRGPCRLALRYRP